MSSKRIKIAIGLALSASVIAGSAVLQAQVAGDTADLNAPTDPETGLNLKKAYYELTPVVVDIATNDSLGGTVQGVVWVVGKAGEGADKVDIAKNFISGEGVGPDGPISKALNVINIVAVGAKAAAYVAEGDYNGAWGVALQELTKKAMEAGASSYMGPFLGPIAGEQAFNQFVKGEMEAGEEFLRNQEYAEKYIPKPWLPPFTIMQPDGTVKLLEPDRYIDPETGNIRRRSKEDQAAYEQGLRKEWRDAKAFDKVTKDFAEGKITKERFEQLKQSYQDRDRFDPLDINKILGKAWDPENVPIDDVSLYTGSYSGRFTGGASGTVNFTVNNGAVSGTLRGTCRVKVCAGDAISASFSGSVDAKGFLTASLSGKVVGAPFGSFGGSFNGVLAQGGGSGGWTGMNEYGGGDARWSVARGN